MRKPVRMSFSGSNCTWDCPARTGDLEASSGDLFASAFNSAAANPVTLFAILGIVHAMLVVGVIGDSTLSRFGGETMIEVLFRRLDNFHVLVAVWNNPPEGGYCPLP